MARRSSESAAGHRIWRYRSGTREATGSRRHALHFCWGVEDFDVDRILRALSEMQAPAQAVLREGKTINGVNFDDPDGVPLQFNPATACGGGGFLGDVCDTAAQAARQPGDPPSIAVPDAQPREADRAECPAQSRLVSETDRHEAPDRSGTGGRTAHSRI